MKTRNGYVSNSSSSSFVVIGDECIKNPLQLSERTLRNELNRCVMAGMLCGWRDDSEMWFGRQEEEYHLFGAKWNWLLMQACYDAMDNANASWQKILDDFTKHLGYDGIDWENVANTILNFDAFIDHQSIDPKSTFDVVLKYGLGEFLADERCCIHNGDDETSIMEDEE